MTEAVATATGSSTASASGVAGRSVAAVGWAYGTAGADPIQPDFPGSPEVIAAPAEPETEHTPAVPEIIAVPEVPPFVVSEPSPGVAAELDRISYLSAPQVPRHFIASAGRGKNVYTSTQ